MSIKGKYCWALVACLLMAVSGFAETMRIGMMVDVKHHLSRLTFEPSKEHGGDGWFYLTRASEDVEFEMRLNMTGQREQSQKGRTQAGEVPGVTDGVSGYKRARIEFFGHEPTLVIETRISRKKTKDGKEQEEKEQNELRLPLEFKTRRTGPDQLQGKTPVELRITRAGLKNLLGEAKTKAAAGMNMKSEGEGASASMSGFSRLLNPSRKGAVFASSDSIQYEAPPMHVRLEGKVKVRGAGIN